MRLGNSQLFIVLSGMSRQFISKIVLVAVILLGSPLIVSAQTVNIESGDIFQLVSPFDASQARGQSQISFKVYDNNQPQVAYQVKLLDEACRTDYGVIATGDAPSLPDKFTNVSWNTNGPLVNRSDVANGNYCLQVCVNLSIRSQPNAVCSTRFISIDNKNNKAPVFTNIPIGTLNTTQNTTFQLRASDSEKDKLVFGLSAAPTFVQLTNDGLLSINPGEASGRFEVIVNVSDGVNAAVEHRFNLQTGAIFVSEQSSNKPTEFIIVSPQLGTIYAGASNNSIKWVISDADGIRDLKIQYASDGKTWNTIVGLNGQGQPANDSNLNWDVSRLAPGNYLLKFIVTDKLGVITEKISERFVVGNITTSATTSVPLIINIRPEDTSEISNRRPEIRGGFVPSYRYTMTTSSFKLLLDNNDITNICEVDTTGFNCKLTTDLTVGKHLLKVLAKDTSGKEAIREWVFTIGSNTTITPTPTTTVSTTPATPVELPSFDIPRFTLLLIIGVCIAAVVLILLPWILYLIWKRRRPEDEFTITPSPNEVTIRVDYPQAPPQPVAVASYMPTPVAPPAPVINLVTTPQPVAQSPVSPPTPIAQPAVEEKKANTSAAATPDWLKERKIEATDSKQIGSFGYGVKADE
jgi:hypothetical protein